MLALVGAPAAALFTVLHGAGNGILTIAKGTLPLVLFGPRGYGARQGLLMVPARFAQALSPWLFGLFLDRWGAGSLWLSAGLGLLAFGRPCCCARPSARARRPRSAGRPGRAAACPALHRRRELRAADRLGHEPSGCWPARQRSRSAGRASAVSATDRRRRPP